MTPILEFDGTDFRFLSNFYIAPFEWLGRVWPHSESAYQAMKTVDSRKWDEFLNITPGQAKRKGKQLVMRPDWEKVKVEIMAEILFHKFDQNPDLKMKLIATGDRHLEEGNTWGDRFWGVCPPGSGNGQNWLGILLMELRNIWTGQCTLSGSQGTILLPLIEFKCP
jgi:ribA/ribD-fused uncharacterized protein